MDVRTLINKNDTDYTGNTKTTNTKIHTRRIQWTLKH